MDSWKIDGEERNTRVFNSPIELGLRCLFILSQFADKPLSIDKLIYFDYFVIHAGDVSKSQKSLHPKYPFRSTEIIVKREILTDALQLLVSKELIEVRFYETGIMYVISTIGKTALDYFESDYAKRIIEISSWLYKNYVDFNEDQLSEIISSNLKKWGGEFVNEAKFRSVSI